MRAKHLKGVLKFLTTRRRARHGRTRKYLHSERSKEQVRLPSVSWTGVRLLVTDAARRGLHRWLVPMGLNPSRVEMVVVVLADDLVVLGLVGRREVAAACRNAKEES